LGLWNWELAVAKLVHACVHVQDVLPELRLVVVEVDNRWAVHIIFVACRDAPKHVHVQGNRLRELRADFGSTLW
jgi:hypothetical protein